MNPKATAKHALRILADTLIRRLEAEDCDLRTEAERAKQVAMLVIADLNATPPEPREEPPCPPN